jgi:hypothetical protein
MAAAAASGTASTFAAAAYRSEALRLYRAMLKSAARFPLKSRRDIATGDVQQLFRTAWAEADAWTADEVEYRMSLAREKRESLARYSENMYWFHSRDEVNKEMLHFSLQRDRERAEEMERCVRVGQAPTKTDEVTQFRSALYHVHPDYYNKVDQVPLKTPQDLWLGRGRYASHIGAKNQRFFVKRYKPLMPNGW